MRELDRVTEPTLDVLEVLIGAGDRGVYGWQAIKAAGRTGPTIYGVLDRLEQAGWVESEWEQLTEEQNRPRRRHYHLTPDGRSRAGELLRARRPQSYVTRGVRLAEGTS